MDRLFTRAYLPEPTEALDSDPLLASVPQERRHTLIAARDELRENGSVEGLVHDGHHARLAYEAIASAPPLPVTGVDIGAPGWAEKLRRQAHQARVWMG